MQLRNQIVLGIGRGELQRGDALPTVRQLAEDLGINAMTANKAYGVLRAEGLIEIDRRHGAKVNPNLNMDREFCEKLEGDLTMLIAESQARGMDETAFLSVCRQVFAGMRQTALE